VPHSGLARLGGKCLLLVDWPYSKARYDGTRFWLALDLDVGLLSGLASGEARRGVMLSAVALIW
jgi:hypothetical protein